MVVAVAGLGAGVRDQLHAEGRLVEVRGLRGVAHDPDQGVPAGHREGVGGRVVLDQPDQLLELVQVQSGQPFVVVQRLLEAHLLFGPYRAAGITGHPAALLRKRCASD